MDAKNGAVVRPSGLISKVVAKCDGKIRADGKLSCGPSKSNTARAQQIEGGLYGANAVSTSCCDSIARFFATSGNTEDGFIYVIDVLQLEREGITVFEYSDPEHPHEQEVTLVLQSHEFIPPSLIVRKYEVKSDWM